MISCTFGREGPRPTRNSATADAWLREALLPEFTRCGADSSSVLLLELTRNEVAAVTAEGAGASCLQEAAWALALDGRFEAEEVFLRLQGSDAHLDVETAR